MQRPSALERSPSTHHMTPRYTVPSVVVGGTLNGLGVARSLSRGGVPVIVVETTRRCPAAWSRHCAFVRAPRLEGDELIDVLIELAKSLGCRPALILTIDQSVMTISASRSRIEPLYHINLPSPDVVLALANKVAFHALSQRSGFAIPRGLAISCRADLDRLVELTPPVIIKPADKTLVLAGVVERAVRAETVAQARVNATQMLIKASPLIVQEWIEGPDTEIYFALFTCGSDTNIVGFFPGRKLVCSPPTMGSTAVCVAAPEVAEEIFRQTRKFVAQVGYQGLGSLEFKRDARSRELLIIEPTVGRTDWQEEIATLCGVNLPLIAYGTAIGRSTHSGRETPPARSVWRAERQFRVPRAISGASVRVFDGYFRWVDPLPAAYYYGYERLAARIWRRAVRLTRGSFHRLAAES